MQLASPNKRTTAFVRYLALLRQFNHVYECIGRLPADQKRRIALTAIAELTGVETSSATPSSDAAVQWSVAAAVAYARLRDDQNALAPLRQWLVAAYRATFNAPYGEQQHLHRLVLRALRQMHGDAPPATSELRAIRQSA